jgi:hypothetical protein
VGEYLKIQQRHQGSVGIKKSIKGSRVQGPGSRVCVVKIQLVDKELNGGAPCRP